MSDRRVQVAVGDEAEVVLDGAARLRADGAATGAPSRNKRDRGDALDAVAARDAGRGVDVDLHDLERVAVLGRECFEFGRDRAARAAPWCPEIDDDGDVGREDFVVEGGVVDVDDCTHG